MGMTQPRSPSVVIFFEDNMAAALAVNEQSESFQSLHRLRAGNDGQFSHAPIQKFGSPLAS
jgi:hypothetical protein